MSDERPSILIGKWIKNDDIGPPKSAVTFPRGVVRIRPEKSGWTVGIGEVKLKDSHGEATFTRLVIARQSSLQAVIAMAHSVIRSGNVPPPEQFRITNFCLDAQVSDA